MILMEASLIEIAPDREIIQCLAALLVIQIVSRKNRRPIIAE